MKKIKVIFPDGSTADIDESDLQAALSAGAKRAGGSTSPKSTSMVFPDGSIADINDDDVSGALKAGAVKKKDGGNTTPVELNGTPAQSVPATLQSPLPEKKNDFSFNPTANVIEKKPIVNVAGAPVPLDIPIPFDNTNKDDFSAQLQARINTKTFTPQDVEVVAKSMKVSPLAASAYMDGKTGTGTVIHFNDIKAEKGTRLQQTVLKANKELGRNDNYEEIFASPELAGAYIEQIQTLYDQKANNEDIASAREFDKEIVVPNFSGIGGGGNSYSRLKSSSEIAKVNRNAAQEIKGIISNDIIEKITADQTLSKDEKVRKIYNLTDKRDFNNVKNAIGGRLDFSSVFNSPVSTLAGLGTGHNKDEIDLLNSNKGSIEFKVNKTLRAQVNYNEALKKSIAEDYASKVVGGEIDANDETARDYYAKRVSDIDAETTHISKEIVPDKAIFEKYPVLYKSAVVNSVNEFNAIKSGNVKGYEDGGYEGITLDEHLRNNGFDPTDQRVKDALDSDNLKDYSFFGRPMENVVDVFVNSGKSILDLTGIRDNVDILSEQKKAELFQTQVGETGQYQLTKAAGIAQNIGNTTGQVIGQGLLQVGTAGLGRMAGLTKVAANGAAFWTSGTLTSYDQAYKDSYDFIDNGLGRTAYAGLIALANGASEKIFPEVKLFQIPGVKEAAGELATKIGTKGFTDELANELLTKSKNAFVDYALKYGKNVSQETIEEVATNLFESGTRFIFGDPNMDVETAIKNAKNTAIQTAIGTSLAGFAGANRDIKQERNTSSKATIYNAALYHDEAMDAINIGFEQKLYGENERDAKIAVLNTAQDAIKVTRATEIIAGKDLTRPEKEVYVANITAEALLKKQRQGIGDDPVMQGSIDEKISNLQNQREQIISGEVVIDDNGNISLPKQTTNEETKTEVPVTATETGVTNEATNSNIGETTQGAQAEIKLTDQEQAAIDGFKTTSKIFPGTVKGWTDVLQSETSTTEEKRQALSELKDQLSDPNSEVAIGAALGKDVDFIYDIIDDEKLYGKPEDRIKVDINNGKLAVEPNKPVSEMSSQELYDYSQQVKDALKTNTDEATIDNVSDLRDTAQSVNFIENSEGINDLAKSIKSVVVRMGENPSDYDLAILNAAKNKAAELGIEPKDLVAEVLKTTANDFKDKTDAEFAMQNVLDKLTSTPEVKQTQISTKNEVVSPSTEKTAVSPTVKSEEVIVHRVGGVKDGATWVAKGEGYGKGQLPEGENKQYVADLGSVFDIRNKEHFNSLKAALIAEHGEQKGTDIFDDAVSGYKTYEDFINATKENKNLFDDFADIGIQGIPDDVFKKMGYDSYLNREGGHETYKVFDSKRVKSENKPIQGEPNTAATAATNRPIQSEEQQPTGQGTESVVQPNTTTGSGTATEATTPVSGNDNSGKPPVDNTPPQPKREGGRLNDKGVLTHLAEAENIPEYSRQAFKTVGLQYETVSQKEAEQIAISIVDEFGIDEAILLAQAEKFDGDVNAMIYGVSLNKLALAEIAETDAAKKRDIAVKIAEITLKLDVAARSKGRFNSALNYFYKKSPLGVKLAENARRANDFDEWASKNKKDKSWKEVFEEIKKIPEVEEIIKEQVDEGMKKERAEARASRIKKVDDFFDSAIDKLGSGGVAYSTIIPITPKTLQAALKGMKAAYHAGESVVKLIDDAIRYITKELGSDKWDVEGFRTEWQNKLRETGTKKVLTDEEVKKRILDKFSNKLKGLTDIQKEEVVLRSFKEIVNNGGLEYDQFKKIIADITGRGELTESEAKRLSELVEATNKVDEAQKKVITERTEESLKEFDKTMLYASKASRELNTLLYTRPNITKRITSLLQLNTLGIAALVNNPIYNIINQVSLRFPVGLVKTMVDKGIYRGAKLFGYEVLPETDITSLQVQKEFFNKLGLGLKESGGQFITGLNRLDYKQKEVYEQQIRPATSVIELWNFAKGKVALTKTQIFDKLLQATFGIPAEGIARTLNLGDKPQRFSAGAAQAAGFAKALGLKDIDYKIFIKFPREEAYRDYKAKGYSDEEAAKKADYIDQTITKEAERSTFQQDNFLNDFFNKVFGGKDSGIGGLAKTVAISPYIKIPSNAYWSYYNLVNPEVALMQSFIYGYKAFVKKRNHTTFWFDKRDSTAAKDLNEAKYWFAHAAVGIATRAVVTALVSAGIFRSGNGEDETKKEREGELFYEPQGSMNYTKLQAWIRGEDPDKVKGGLIVPMRWIGHWGSVANTIAKRNEDMTPEQKANQNDYVDMLLGNLSNSGLKELEQGIFGNTSSLIKAVSGGGVDMQRWGVNTLNLFTNIVHPAIFAQISKAQLPYYTKMKADTFMGELKNNMLQRSSVVRNLANEMPPSKVGIWGDRLDKQGGFMLRLFGISKIDDDNFAQPIYEDYKRTTDTRFFPSAVMPVIEDGGKTHKLNVEQTTKLEQYIGRARKDAASKYVNNMATFEGSGKYYKDLTDKEKIDNLKIIYDLGYKTGKQQFLDAYPQFKAVELSDEEKQSRKEAAKEKRKLRKQIQEELND